MKNETVQRNLAVVAAASKAAGLEGFLRVEDVADNGGERFLSLDQAMALDGDEASKIASWELRANVSPEPSRKDRGRPDPEAVLSCWMEGEVVSMKWNSSSSAGDLWRQQQLVWEKNAAKTIADLEAHEAVLKEMRLCTYLDRGKWKDKGSDGEYQTFERQARLYVVAILAEPIQGERFECHAARTAFLSLATAAGEEPLEYGLPLSAPFFGGQSSPEEFVKATAIAPDQLVKLADQWERCGRNHRNFARLLRQTQGAESEGTKFLIDGLIPMGSVLTFAGPRGVGKSTALHALAVAAGTVREPGDAPTEWLGINLSDAQAGGTVVFLSGEDPLPLMIQRQNKLCRGDRECRIFLEYGHNKHDLASLLSDISTMPSIRLLIVDPARPFYDGSEDNSGDVDQLFKQLNEFAERTGAAVILCQHLTKNAEPHSLKEVAESVKGSGVFLDRPRAAIGMYRRRDGRICVGIIKWNYMDAPVWGEAFKGGVFERDDASKRLVLVEGEAADLARSRPAIAEAQGQAPADAPADAGPAPLSDSLIASLIGVYSSSGRPVTTTGRHSLFGRKPTELADYTRAEIEAAVAGALERGVLKKGRDGHLNVAQNSAQRAPLSSPTPAFPPSPTMQ